MEIEASNHPSNALAYDSVRAEAEIQLSPEEQAVFEKKLEAFQKLILHKDPLKAKYKIEVLFGKARSTRRPTPGVITFWENGTKFNGGGDVKIYMCPGKYLGVNDCEGFIPDASNTMGKLVCHHCGTVWKAEQAVGEVFLNLGMRKWAEVIYRHFRLLEYHCDIYLKHAPEDIRSQALAQADKATFRGSEAMDRLRAKRARHIYPLRNILKDTSAGADLLGRLYSFLVS